MKAVLLAGGNGTRLYDNTRVVNKHLCRVADRPMIEYPLATIKKCGINDVMVITGKQHGNTIFEYLSDGSTYGMRFSFRLQENAGGIAEALDLARGFVGDSDCLVILGDNIFEDDFSKDVKNFTGGAKVFIKEVPDPDRFGVATVIGDSVMEIEEKPKYPKSNYAVTGLYLYDSSVFEKIDRIEYSARGEKEISDVNNIFIREKNMKFSSVPGFWSDAGTINSLKTCDQYFYNKI